MNLKLNRLMCGTAVLVPTIATRAQDTGADWHPHSLGGAVWQTALFALLGVVLAIAGYKIFDLATPGKLHEEILQNKNVAAAIIGAAVILGVCVLVAAAMLG